MKRKIQFLLFAVLIAVIILIAIFVYVNINRDNISQENTEDNITLGQEADSIMEFSIMAINTLPPGSTSVDLQNAINSATSGDTIIISSDMQFSTYVEIPIRKTITIQSDTGNAWKLIATNSSQHFIVRGKLTLQNTILDGATIGGGMFVSPYEQASLTMNIGTVVQNCNRSGVENWGIFIMNDGIIRNNVSSNYGGGVNANGSFTMYGGIITGNTSKSGGGIFIAHNSTIYNGTISNNHSSIDGGGISISEPLSLTMHNGIISGNTADNSGGRYACFWKF